MNSPAIFHGAVIFLHGTGDSGPGLNGGINHISPSFLSRLAHEGIKVLFPSAPARPYTLAGGLPTTIWHDRKSLAGDGDEDVAGLAETAEALAEIIRQLEEEGIERHRIVIGGFSQGGGASIYSAFALPLFGSDLAGVFSMGSWVTTKSKMWPELAKPRAELKRRLPPVFMSHGAVDGLIDYEWGAETRDGLRAAGVDVSWLLEQGVAHEPGPQSLDALRDWILKTIPVSATM